MFYSLFCSFVFETGIHFLVALAALNPPFFDPHIQALALGLSHDIQSELAL